MLIKNTYITNVVIDLSLESSVLIDHCIQAGNYGPKDNTAQFRYTNCIFVASGSSNSSNNQPYHNSLGSTLDHCIYNTTNTTGYYYGIVLRTDNTVIKDCIAVQISDIFNDASDGTYSATRTFELDNNKLTATTDRTWLSIEGQPVAYYHTSTFENGDEYIITGYVPVLLNGDTAKLQLVFTNEYPEGRIAGIIPDYTEGETHTIAKAQTDLTVGDKLDFICDYYTYDGEFKDKYKLGKQVTVTENMKISDTKVGDGRMRILYRFTDIYDEYYWSEPIILE